MNNGLKLQNGDRIAVIGAGPAGTFFSLSALKFARATGLDISITIFDGKDFIKPGPPGCNMCAGVISENLSQKMHAAGIDLPADRVQMEIDNYTLSTPHYTIGLHRRPRSFPIRTVYRGNGPYDRVSFENVSFDDYLLRLCMTEGITVIRDMITDMTLPAEKTAPVTLKCRSTSKPFTANFILVACGLNTNFHRLLSNLGFGYKPPGTVFTCQAEIPLPGEFIENKFNRKITTLALNIPKVRFAAFTPKGEHLTVTVIGKRDVDINDMKAVLEHPKVKDDLLEGLPIPDTFCYCRPRIAVSPARNIMTDRLLVIGDAAFSRYYKNGIESAFDTARVAASCVIDQGISGSQLNQHYLTKEVRAIRNSAYYGRALFRFFDFAFKSHLLSGSLVSFLSKNRTSSAAQVMLGVLWDVFTGRKIYRNITVDLFHLRLQARLILEMLLLMVKKTIMRKGALDSGKTINCEVDSLGPLGSGQSVVIIGGGPGGVGCALALQKFARQKGIDLEITIYEGKDFGAQPHYNQCVGVLSPPIEEIFSEELDLPFPYHLEQRKISGYVLHSKNQSLFLSGEDEASISVRRVNFDQYMLEQAKIRGIEVIQSRVTDVEFDEDGVMVYSETDNRHAEVVVGAFGLDDGTAKIFERASRYQQPRFLNSIVSKIHPGEQLVEAVADNIHAYLPSAPEIEFGAITPKKNHLTINVAGAEVTADSLRHFIQLPEVLAELPSRDHWNPDDLHFFKGRFPIRVAKGFYGDRYVVIGDAAGLLRPFKGKGVNMAIFTGMRAAKTMLDVGISRQAFKIFLKKCHDITDDLPYGKVFRWLTLKIARWNILDPILATARDDDRMERALFDSISAHRTIKSIFGQLFNLQLLLRITQAIFKDRIGRVIKGKR
jgi:flavin-dependent dehydrogenase